MCLRIITDNVKFKTAEEDMTFYKVVKYNEEADDINCFFDTLSNGRTRWSQSQVIITSPHYVSPYWHTPIRPGNLYQNENAVVLNKVYDYGDEIGEGVFHLCKTMDDAIKTCAVIVSEWHEFNLFDSHALRILPPIAILKATIPRGSKYIEGTFPISYGIALNNRSGEIMENTLSFYEVDYTPSVVATDKVMYGEEMPMDLERLNIEIDMFIKSKETAEAEKKREMEERIENKGKKK